jgi:cysteine desulfurase
MLTNSLLAVGAVQNGNGARLPNILNISIPGLDSEAAILLLKGTAEVSNGSACTSNKYEPSHVLQAMGLSRDRTLGAIRFSWDHSTNTEIIPVICEILKSAAVSK